MKKNLTEEFTKESIDYLNNADLKKRKNLGQYFTPKSIRELLLSKLPKKDNANILDPACGSGEFLLSCEKYFKNPKLNGFEIDKNLVSIASKLIKNSNIKNIDALNIDIKNKYDYVIGNPPYFEIKLNEEFKAKHFEIIKGRVNIFSLFIKIGLEALKDGGYLAYVVPPSMNNGAYFSKLREYIIKNASLEYLHIIDGADNFHSANQKVMLMILKKTNTKKSNKYIFQKNGIMIFTEDKKFLNEVYKNTVCLKEIGYGVKTGSIVWNEHKEKLTNDKNNSTLLIWSSNINNGKIVMPNSKGKPQYIKNIPKDLIIKSRVVVVNRITGSSKYINIKSAIVNEKEFVCENHVNVIYPLKNANCNYSLEDILNALQDETNMKVMRLISGNTQVSKIELERLLPIKINWT
ncbi:HsdM family class I SAM-dependent methyltransferase [Brachyspira catarrhinii]|uniref:site-specific DNA-methyltransferase (adenine-specific) n=1 Tax=Brachyspira catarrhinii TaxID=2528966 RepID=A0ABY2TP40_9SPIR|nr:N-6 DNA methylase [Brachyspira catarrhinii]TKZ32046.1 modification methylase [Brachyspira catarrhinii]